MASTETDDSLNTNEHAVSLRLEPEEESKLIEESNNLKSTANGCFTSSDYDAAITGYNRALDVLPSYLDFQVAVLKSNIAACYIKLEEWKTAIDAATVAVDSLETLDPVPLPKKEFDANAPEEVDGEQGNDKVAEIDDSTAEQIEALHRTGHNIDDVRRIRAKALLRRAKARTESGGWANLAGADEDYKQLAAMPNLTATDRKTVQSALRELPPRLEEAKQKEMADMMGKLKQLGNGILKPFGLSTDNFNVVKDEKSGGYSLQFNQNK